MNKGAIFLDYLFETTGAILTARLLSDMKKRSKTKYGLVSIYIGEGISTSSIFEYVR